MGIVHTSFVQCFPGQSKWSVDQIPDLTGTVTIVTGANSGIGKETAKALLNHNAKVYIAGRSQQRVEAAIKDLHEETGKEAIFLHLDLADLKTVKASAAEFMSKEKELHVLFNSAGVMFTPVNQLTADGYDMQFGTNVLGHFYFTKCLLPVLLSTAENSPPGKVRVVNTSSMIAYVGSLNFNAFKDGPQRKKLGTYMLYAQSKFGNIVYANEFGRQYGQIVSTSLNPGNLKTELTRHISTVEKFLLRPIQFPAPYGALTQLWAGTSASDTEINGKFLVPWAKVGKPPKGADDPQLGKDLWAWLEEQVKDV